MDHNIEWVRIFCGGNFKTRIRQEMDELNFWNKLGICNKIGDICRSIVSQEAKVEFRAVRRKKKLETQFLLLIGGKEGTTILVESFENERISMISSKFCNCLIKTIGTDLNMRRMSSQPGI